jgi:hypothetical protein
MSRRKQRRPPLQQWFFGESQTKSPAAKEAPGAIRHNAFLTITANS